MSLNIHNVSFGYPARETLFENINLSVGDGEKASLIGDNGVGKSTLLRVITGALSSLSGEMSRPEDLWLIPQHFGQYDNLTIAGALGIEGKLAALESILAGSVAEHDFAALADDWEIAQRTASALAEWGLADSDRNAAGHSEFTPNRPFNTLSGGEKTKVFLAGIALHNPSLVVMDEPTNHLDSDTRHKLYALIERSRAAMLIVSHDRVLLNMMETTWELTARGTERYGGNYDHYKALSDAKLNALEKQIGENEKTLRVAHKTVRQTLERQTRRESKGTDKATREGIPRIMMKTLKDSAAATTLRLKESHSAKIDTIQDELRQRREERPQNALIKIRFADSRLHSGKTLVAGSEINFTYDDKKLWAENFSFRIENGERVVIRGGNGSGKTTLARLILGELEPTEGEIYRSGARILYIDQQYSLVDDRLTVVEQAAAFNTRNLPDHIVKTELHRFLFPADTWDKPCCALSGGEKMKLIFCSLLIGDNAPDVFILDEPTNNLDIRSLELITSALKEYQGTVIVISHDESFVGDIGITKEIFPGKTIL